MVFIDLLDFAFWGLVRNVFCFLFALFSPSSSLSSSVTGGCNNSGYPMTYLTSGNVFLRSKEFKSSSIALPSSSGMLIKLFCDVCSAWILAKIFKGSSESSLIWKQMFTLSNMHLLTNKEWRHGN